MRRSFHIKSAVIALALLAVSGSPARAQGFISPLIGYNFGGDSGCPEITDCDDKALNLGVAFGALGTIFGFEEELNYAQDFFGAGPGFDSNVLTLMSNILIAPKIGPVRPYAVGGVGLIKQRISFTQEQILDSNNNDFGWTLGGGVMGFFNDHVGVRGDIRMYHTFGDVELLGIENRKLDFGRFSGSVVFVF
jgi:opacity protein-like surface antigen